MDAKAANLALPRHRVGVVVFDGVAMFELAVACEVFRGARSLEADAPIYDVDVCGQRRTTELVGGLRLAVPYRLGQLSHADTIVVPPSETDADAPPEVLAALRAAHARGARILSLCTGTFALARAGLLDGRRATTHWEECADLARRHPLVTVDPGVLYVDDGDILTAAGSAASIDLCLHVVRKDNGAEVATRLARELVVPPYRDGGQAQYIETPRPEVTGSDLFAGTITWVQANLGEEVTIDDLAARAAMSRRTFARRFAATTGTTPYQWLLRQRLQLAQRLLETTDLPIELVAGRSGFITAGNLRKHFGRVIRTTPQAYRNTFRARALT
jgi:AraC family transcriptional regulator, transcriptional activator FtrA